MAIDISRTWWAVERLIDDEEKGRCLTVVGTLVRPRQGVSGLKRDMASEVRDVVVFANTRTLVISPEPPSNMTMFKAVRAAMGSKGAIGKVAAFRRDGLTGFVHSRSLPANVPELAGIKSKHTWLTLEFDNDDQLHLLRDTKNDPKENLDTKIQSYLDGAQF